MPARLGVSLEALFIILMIASNDAVVALGDYRQCWTAVGNSVSVGRPNQQIHLPFRRAKETFPPKLDLESGEWPS